MISQRTREALARIRACGRVLGRPPGRRNNKLKLAGREGIARRLLLCGYSRVKVARRLKVHRDTLAAFLKVSTDKP
jgi:DNA invertase Pin-like site-specific DNA recombinase